MASDKPIKTKANKALTYANYLKIDTLLSLQQPRSTGPEHDEMLFIITHQVYELWFKELLHELDRACHLLYDGHLHRTQHTLKRILMIFQVLIAQIDILETMTPLEFLTFRERLEAASGFQSDQFRQIEFILGKRSAKAMKYFPANSRARRTLIRRYQDPSLWDAFLHYLRQEGYPIPNEQLTRDVTLRVQSSTDIQQILINIYHQDPKNAELCEWLIDLDEGMEEWRYRHMKMVERTIGTRPGTGGSSGVTYLKTTLSDPFFPDLWMIRSQL
ncbi:tryptophan 2,3-dioxygenase [Legionella nagasakiensis]|uniref:tryptophan 2,3-dioxygenase n=1 Tax=Legionella nagasakiensis TaxID=535290 RepID=UPI001054C1F7|nr:tryptophan 2,3-dioxygenase family protein [Legionella nagasakiensis]